MSNLPTFALALLLTSAGTAALASDVGVAVDIDADGIPDDRDVCLDAFAERRSPASVDRFGCEGASEDDPGGEGAALLLEGVTFRAGESGLDGEARATLDRVARALLGSADGERFEVGAHTDGVGSPEPNRRLSERRAETVRRYLMLRGVGPNRLDVRGYGEARPITDERSIADRLRNRRIELRRLGTR